MKDPINLGNGHLDTIIPYYLRPTPHIKYQRERIKTPDSDFLDLDWSIQNSKKLIILTHGFESNSDAKYIKGMAKTFFNNGFDILAWNFRSCSGEMNRQPIFYHSGATYDIDTVIQHAQRKNYEEINLIGFSMGGNLTLKYLGETTRTIPMTIKKACVFSVPCSLYSSSKTLERGFSKKYSQIFLKSLKEKVFQKRVLLQSKGIDHHQINQIHTLYEFDNLVTAPLHGFHDACDYYEQSSANKYIPHIKIPTLIVNALNDPFLGDECYPVSLVEVHRYVELQTPQYGGHVGFMNKLSFHSPWSEEVALDFITKI